MDVQNKPKRKNIRLSGYDYSQPNYYYITICTKNRECCLGYCRGEHCSPADNNIELTKIGLITEKAVNLISENYDMVLVDKYIIMPNHIHMIIVIKSDKYGRAMHAPTLSTVISQLKGYVTKNTGYSIWQKGFYDEIIKNNKAYLNIWEYIETNQLKWFDDEYFKNTNKNKGN